MTIATETISSTPGDIARARASLGALARHNARRYARHPLFLLSAAALAATAWVTTDDAQGEFSIFAFYTALLVGTLGVLIGYRLARSTDVSREVADVAAVPRATQTAALCLACLVPAVAAALITVFAFVLARLRQPADEPYWAGGLDAVTLTAVLLAAIAACSGGPLFGVLVARWTRFPGAGLVAMVVLIAWTLLGSVGTQFDDPTRLSALARLHAPYAAWAVTAGGPDAEHSQIEGSAVAHLGYVIALCLLGAVLAMLRDAQGDQRKRLIRAAIVIGIAGLAFLALAIAPEPARPLLHLADR